MYSVKLALAVILCGGVEREDQGGATRVRGEPHMVNVPSMYSVCNTYYVGILLRLGVY